MTLHYLYSHFGLLAKNNSTCRLSFRVLFCISAGFVSYSFFYKFFIKNLHTTLWIYCGKVWRKAICLYKKMVKL